MRILLALLLLLSVTNQGLATALRNQVQSLVGKHLSGSLAIITNINQVDEHGRNALHYAAELGDLPLVLFLTDHGINTKDKDNDGLLPLDHAINKAYENKTNQQLLIVSYILEKTWGVGGQDEGGWLPLTWAIAANNLQRVKELVDKMSVVTIVDLNNQADILEVADLMGNDKIIKLLAPITEQPQMMRWASNAVFDSNPTRIKAVLAKGFDPNTTDRYGGTLLHYLAEIKSTPETIEIARLLLEAGANPNVANNRAWTPLHKTASNKNIEMTILLLEAGANPNAIGRDGQTPLHNSAFLYGISYKKTEETTRLLLKHDADPNAVDNKGQTPLHKSAYKGFIGATKLLLEYDADPNAIDNEGQTPLHKVHPYRIGAGPTAELLLENGADPDAVDNEGQKPTCRDYWQPHHPSDDILIDGCKLH